MATRHRRRNLKRTVKNKKRKSYRKRGGGGNPPDMNARILSRVTDPVFVSASGSR